MEDFQAMSAYMRHINSLRKPFIRGICNLYDCASLSNFDENDLKNYYPVLPDTELNNKCSSRSLQIRTYCKVKLTAVDSCKYGLCNSLK